MDLCLLFWFWAAHPHDYDIHHRLLQQSIFEIWSYPTVWPPPSTHPFIYQPFIHLLPNLTTILNTLSLKRYSKWSKLSPKGLSSRDLVESMLVVSFTLLSTIYSSDPPRIGPRCRLELETKISPCMWSGLLTTCSINNNCYYLVRFSTTLK